MHFERIIKQLKERREALQVTQEMLADISGVSLRALKQFESGKGNPTLETLTKLMLTGINPNANAESVIPR